jgi:hypothetical protein
MNCLSARNLNGSPQGPQGLDDQRIIRMRAGGAVITMTNDLGGLLFNTTKRPNKNKSTQGVALSRDGFDPNRDS